MTQDPQWSGEKRKINGQFIKDYFPQPQTNIYFVTGTPRFVPAVFREIKNAGVPILNLRMEIFTGY
jgi:predicted ferric reductase